MKKSHYYIGRELGNGENVICCEGTLDDILKYLISENQIVDYRILPEINRYLSEMLAFVGIPANLRGYEYLKTATIRVLNEPDLLRRKVTSNLYPTIASQFSTNPASVERAIRHAITVAWDRGNRAELYDIFENSISDKCGKPTNSEFIAKMAELCKAEQEIMGIINT